MRRTLARGCDTEAVPVRRFVTLLAFVTLAVIGALSACSDDHGNTKAFCASLRSGDNPVDVFDRYDPTNVATARQELQQGLDRLQQLERAAPSEVRSQVHVLVGVAQQLVTTLDPSQVGKPPPDFQSEFQRVRDASAAVTAFASTNCGVDLVSSAPGG